MLNKLQNWYRKNDEILDTASGPFLPDKQGYHFVLMHIYILIYQLDLNNYGEWGGVFVSQDLMFQHCINLAAPLLICNVPLWGLCKSGAPWKSFRCIGCCAFHHCIVLWTVLPMTENALFVKICANVNAPLLVLCKLCCPHYSTNLDALTSKSSSGNRFWAVPRSKHDQ